MKVLRNAVIAAAVLALAPAAWAQGTDTDNMNVTATVEDAVRIVSVADIAFGNYDPTDPVDVTANGSMTISASNNLSYTVYITGARTMTDGTDFLNYDIFVDAGLTNPWPQLQPSGETYVSTGIADVVYTIYGKLDKWQDVPAGAYANTMQVSIEW